MYEFFLESMYLLWKNGITISFLGAFLYYALRTKRVKKRIKKYAPWLFGDESEVKEYIFNQKLIMSKQEALLNNQKNIAEGLGIIWIAPILPESLTISTKDTSKSSRSSQTIKVIVGIARKYMKFGGKIMNKFKSRKFLLAVITGVLIVLNDGLDLGINSEAVMTFAGIVVTWIVGESFVDGKRAASNENNSNGEEYHH